MRLQHFFATYPMFDIPIARHETRLIASNENRHFRSNEFSNEFLIGTFGLVSKRGIL
jgi:hypothetical protein